MSDKEKVIGEEVEVVGFLTLGGLFHGGSGPELGEIDVELKMGTIERLQCGLVNSSEDVFVDLMTVAQHQRITEALLGEVERKQREIDLLWSDRRKDAALIAELSAQLAQRQGVPDIDALVSSFLSWPLPDDVCADPCASMPGYPHRTGTNLLNAEQAKAMLLHVLAAAPAPAAEPASPWVAVSDRLPQIETDVVVRFVFGGAIYHTVAGLFGDDGEFEWWEQSSQAEFRGQVTHWMPLPPAPEVV